MSAREQVTENCDSADRSGEGSLSAEELAIIDRLGAEFRKRVLVECTACGYCMPCPEGVDIPDCFAILNNVSLAAQGNFNQRMYTYFMRRRYRKKAHDKKQLEKRPDSGSAALCVACGLCKKKCPQGIDVPAELEKVHAVLARGEKIERLFAPDD
jgi:predicted aldo/keto reductase-like oxidoreductase